MSEEGQKLVAKMNDATGTAAVMCSGLGPALRLLVSWIFKVEVRLAALERGEK
jgi:hypothetical protein